MTLRRLFAGSIVVLALLGGACILGPKQDDPTAANGPGDDSGFGSDAASSDGYVPRDTSTGGVDAPHDTTFTEDTTPTGDVAGGDTAISDAPGDTGRSDTGVDVGGDAVDEASDDAGSGGGDGSVE